MTFTIRKAMVPAALLLFFIAIALVHIYRPGGERYDAITKAVNIAADSIAVLLGAYAFFHFRWQSKLGKAISLMTLTLVLWFIADMIWAFSDTPTVSLADAFYMLGYVSMAFSLILGAQLMKANILKDRRFMSTLIAGAAIAGLVYFRIFPLGINPEYSLTENLFTAGYIVIDFLILVAALPLVLEFLSGQFSAGWAIVIAGMLIYIYGDIWYALNSESYVMGMPIDLTWYIGYIIVGYGLYHLRTSAESILETTVKARAHKTKQR